MHILFVSSGNSNTGISPIIKNQGVSLISIGHSVSFFTIQGKGLKGYLKNIFILRIFLNKNRFDVIHAHYGLCGVISLFAKRKESLVVSLMGDDILGSNNPDGSKVFKSQVIGFINKWISRFFYSATIVKSKEMLSKHGNMNNLFLIANGIDLSKFHPLLKEDCQKKLSWKNDCYNLLFAANPERVEKNYALVEKAVELLKDKFKIKLHFLKGVSSDDIPIYMNASDLVILSSFHEGSPNVIKEAMACNCPVVSTNVGDVEWLFGNTNGCFIINFQPEDVAEKIKRGFEFEQKTKGREQINELGLDSITVAKKITEVYNITLNK